jgi:ectoine hydroxylase-related dioxygenase (phytanoyl-CoA dioxygenase family)
VLLIYFALPMQLPPDFPMGVNCIHMLTDFSRENGCTRVVLGSHWRREVPPIFADGRHQGKVWSALELSAEEGEQSSGCIGPAGSVAVVCNNTWHAAGANRTLAPRVGVAISYAPWYLGRITMDMVPITPTAFGRLQTAAGRALTKHQLGWLSTGEAADAMGPLEPSARL